MNAIFRYSTVRPVRALALFGLLAVASCSGRADRPGDNGSNDDVGVDDSDDPNDPCPGGIEKDSHIASDLPRICSYILECSPVVEEFSTVPECIDFIVEGPYERSSCWNRCNARDCRVWLDSDPECEFDSEGVAEVAAPCAFVTAFCP